MTSASKESSKASRPVLSGRGRPLPARWIDSVHAGVHSLHSLRARAPIIDQLQLPVVVAHSVPGRLNRFGYCSLELACQMCWFSAFHASLNLKLCALYIL